MKYVKTMEYCHRDERVEITSNSLNALVSYAPRFRKRAARSVYDSHFAVLVVASSSIGSLWTVGISVTLE